MKVDVGGHMLRGAFFRFFNHGTVNDNPYADAPGSYVARRAWRYGFLHHIEVMEAVTNRQPIDQAKVLGEP